MCILIQLTLLILCSLASSFVMAQDPKSSSLIAASQGEASAIFFKMDESSAPLITPSKFNDPEECRVRNGIANFFSKAKTGSKLRVAYLGGSITRSNNMYRLQSAKFIQSIFSKSKIEGINAGI